MFFSPQMKVMDNKLFSIEPKGGTLDPGETETVTLTYCHAMAGTDRLPVLMKLARGREILVSIAKVIETRNFKKNGVFTIIFLTSFVIYCYLLEHTLVYYSTILVGFLFFWCQI